MKEITLENLRKQQIQILDHVVDFCNQHGIRYFLMAGTLLGAIRHQGYIPWDDDIDIGMLRKDYENFLELYSKVQQSNYYIYTNQLNSKSTFPFIKICLKNSLVKESLLNSSDLYGINIDLFPIDDISSSNPKRIVNKITMLLRLRNLKTLNLSECWRRGDKFFLIRACLKVPLFFLSYESIFDAIDRIIDSERNLPIRYRGNILWGYGYRELVEPIVFDEFVDVIFEGKSYKAPKNYHDWLTSIYGDYMQLPPLEKRKSHHNLKAYIIS